MAGELQVAGLLRNTRSYVSFKIYNAIRPLAITRSLATKGLTTPSSACEPRQLLENPPFGFGPATLPILHPPLLHGLGCAVGSGRSDVFSSKYGVQD